MPTLMTRSPDRMWLREELLQLLSVAGTLAGLFITAVALLHTAGHADASPTIVDDMLVSSALLFLLCTYAIFFALARQRRADGGRNATTTTWRARPPRPTTWPAAARARGTGRLGALHQPPRAAGQRGDQQQRDDGAEPAAWAGGGRRGRCGHGLGRRILGLHVLSL